MTLVFNRSTGLGHDRIAEAGTIHDVSDELGKKLVNIGARNRIEKFDPQNDKHRTIAENAKKGVK